MAKGYTQTEGLDFLETLSPVAKMTTIKLVLTLAAINNLYLKQLDVNTAFLHGDLYEEVYMTFPLSIQYELPGQVCHLQKSLYGRFEASK